MQITNYSVLGRLRSLVPTRDDVSFDEALRIAELQATRLSELLASDDILKEGDIAGLPRLRVVYEQLEVSGMSHWNGYEWVVTLNSGDSWARQRFTLLHEFKHIVDHGHASRLYRGVDKITSAQEAERAADFFAGCALVPKRFLKSAWGQGIQQVADLAAHFGVSEHAISVRLAQTKLNAVADAVDAPRCARPVSTPRGAIQRFRSASPHYARRMSA